LYHSPYLAVPSVRCPSVLTLYDLNPVLLSDYYDHLSALKRWIARTLLRRAIKRCSLVLAISETIRVLTEAEFPGAHGKVRTVHLGVDRQLWQGMIETNPQGTRHSSGSAPRPYVLYVGVDRPHKNLIRLVRAFARFRATHGWLKGTGPYLWLLGVGSGSQDLRAAVLANGLSDDALLSGSVDDGFLAGAYRSAGLVAYVSTSEGFGLPLLEAFAAKVPVVASDAGSLPEVGGDAVLYVPPTDEGQVADALSRVWHDETLRRALVARGLERVAGFSWEATARATATAYREVLKVEHE